ncbi:MAG: hypothetical protein ACXV5Q_04085 [Frankiaceae bacterium]
MRDKHPDLLTGSHPAGRRRLRLTALPTATAADAVPRAPKGLGPVGQRAWHRLWRAAGPAWQPATDCYMVETFCSLLDRRHEFRATLDRDGWTPRAAAGRTPRTRWQSCCTRRSGCSSR